MAVNSSIIRSISKNVGILGVLSLSQILFEYIAAWQFSVHQFEKYVFYRNIFIPTVFLASFGINETIARCSGNCIKEKNSLAIVAFGLVGFVAFFFSFFVLRFVPEGMGLPGELSFVLILFWGCGQVVASLLRSEGYFSLGIIARDGWRFILWGGLCFGVVGFGNLVESVYSSIATFYFIITFWVFFRNIRLNAGFSRLRGSFNTWKISISFWVNGLLLVGLGYLDQIMLGFFVSEPGQLKQYSIAILFVVSPFLLVSMASGFILMPIIAKGRAGDIGKFIFISKYNNYNLLFLAVSIIVVATAYFFVVRVVMRFVNVEIDFFLYLVLFCTGLIRLAYSLPSSFVGAKGSVLDINGMTIISGAIFLPQIFLMYFLFGNFGPLGLAVGALLAWVSRVAVSWVYMKKVYLRDVYA